MPIRLAILIAVAVLFLTGCPGVTPVDPHSPTGPSTSDPWWSDPPCPAEVEFLLDQGVHEEDVVAEKFMECLTPAPDDTVFWRIIFYVKDDKPIAFKELDFYRHVPQSGAQLTRKAVFPLDCYTEGNVVINSDSANLSGGYIFCQEQESLRQIVSALSDGQIAHYDDGASFKGKNVAVYVERDTSTSLAAQDFHQLVSYPQTDTGTGTGTGGVSFAIDGIDGAKAVLEISGADLQSADVFSPDEHDWLCVRQRENVPLTFDFSLDSYAPTPFSTSHGNCQNALGSDIVSISGTVPISGTADVHLFDTTVRQTLFIGYHPDPAMRFMGTIKKVIFDPNDSCYGC